VLLVPPLWLLGVNRDRHPRLDGAHELDKFGAGGVAS
jgi:hypothetical protein